MISVLLYAMTSFLSLADKNKKTFQLWLQKYSMGSYFAALEEEGFDAVESLILLSEKDIDELCTAINMKRGHKIRFPVVIAEAREEASEKDNEKKIAKEQERREKEELEEERRREKEKQRRDEEDLEEHEVS